MINRNQLSQELGDPIRRAFLLREQSRLLVAQGKYTRVIESAEESQKIFNEIGSSWYASATLGYVGTAYRVQGDYAVAEQLTRQSLEPSKAVGNPKYTTLCLKNLGCLAYDRQVYHQAEQFFQEALAILEQTGNEAERASILCYLGHVAAVSDESREVEARHFYKKALQLSIKHRVALVALDVFVGVAGLLAQLGETQHAVELLSLAEQHPASTHETKEKARERLAKLETDLPTAVATTAKTRGQMSDWRSPAAQLIEELI